MPGFTKRPTIADQFAGQQAAALKTWRRAVSAHVAGRPIDLAGVLAVAPLIGVVATEASVAFAADVCALEQLPELEQHAVASEKAAKASQKAAPTTDELNRMREKLAAMEQAAAAAVWDPASAAEARAQVNRHRQANLSRNPPRNWSLPAKPKKSGSATTTTEHHHRSPRHGTTRDCNPPSRATQRPRPAIGHQASVPPARSGAGRSSRSRTRPRRGAFRFMGWRRSPRQHPSCWRQQAARGHRGGDKND
jgi:hypothetical protein